MLEKAIMEAGIPDNKGFDFGLTAMTKPSEFLKKKIANPRRKSK